MSLDSHPTEKSTEIGGVEGGDVMSTDIWPVLQGDA